MKKSLKLISVLLVFAIMSTFMTISSSALATELIAGSTKATATNIPAFGTEYVSSLSAAKEQDWFKFKTISSDAYYTIKITNYSVPANSTTENYALNLYIYNIYDQLVSHITASNSSNVKLESNTDYYIKVSTGKYVDTATGNYELKISYKLDPNPNSKADATAISVNTLYKPSLDGVGDADWFKLTAPINGKYTFKFENYSVPLNSSTENYALNFYVYDVYDKLILHKLGTASGELTLEAGATYYIRVQNGKYETAATGNYGIMVQCDGYTGTQDPTPTPTPTPTPDPDPTPTPTPTPDPDPTPTPTPTGKQLVRLNIDTMPTKTTFVVGDSFNSSGLLVSAIYNDGSRKRITNYNLSGFDSSAEGISVVTISYTENGITKAVAYECTIVAEIENTDEGDDGFNFSFSSIFDLFTLLIDLIAKASGWLLDLWTNL